MEEEEEEEEEESEEEDSEDEEDDSEAEDTEASTSSSLVVVDKDSEDEANATQIEASSQILAGSEANAEKGGFGGPVAVGAVDALEAEPPSLLQVPLIPETVEISKEVPLMSKGPQTPAVVDFEVGVSSSKKTDGEYLSNPIEEKVDLHHEKQNLGSKVADSPMISAGVEEVAKAIGVPKSPLKSKEAEVEVAPATGNQAEVEASGVGPADADLSCGARLPVKLKCESLSVDDIMCEIEGIASSSKQSTPLTKEFMVPEVFIPEIKVGLLSVTCFV